MRSTIHVLSLLTSLVLAFRPTVAAPVCPKECFQSPTCEERLARAKAHGCVVEPAPRVEVRTVEVPGPERVVTKEVQVQVPTPGPERIIYKTTLLPTPPKGHGVLAFGPMWKAHDWGATALGGYVWPNGWGIVGGPFWLPRDPTVGVARKGCVSIPYSVGAPSQWGAQALVVKLF